MPESRRLLMRRFGRSVLEARPGLFLEKRRSPVSWSVGLAAAAFGFVAEGARAQTIDQYLPSNFSNFTEPSSVPVLARPRSAYTPLGIRVGEFTIRPNLDEGTGFDDNPAGLSSKRGSAVVTTAPSVAVSSDFSRGSLGVNLGLVDTRYFEQPQESRTDYTASGGTSIALGRDTLLLQGSYLALHEDPTQINSAQLTTPLAFVAKQLQATYTTDFGRWRIEPNLAYLTYRFSNVTEPGDTLSQQARDRDLYSAGLTVRFGFQQSRSAVVTVRAVDTNYVGSLEGQARPDSYAYSILAGADYALSGNLRFLALVGYEVRQFSNRSYRNQAAPVVEASSVWTPTGLTTITGRVSRTIEDSIGESTSGVTYTRAEAKVDHELRRNWLLQATSGFEIAEYAFGGQETIFRAGAGATYLFNRNLRARLSYDFEDRTGVANGVTGNLNGLTINRGAGNFTREIMLLTVSAGL